MAIGPQPGQVSDAKLCGIILYDQAPSMGGTASPIRPRIHKCVHFSTTVTRPRALRLNAVVQLLDT